MQILPGDVIKLGWNGAKHLGDENLAYEQVRVEATGARPGSTQEAGLCRRGSSASDQRRGSPAVNRHRRRLDSL